MPRGPEGQARPLADLTGRRLGDYESQSLIGHAGMAGLHRDCHRPTGRLVAVRVISPQAAENDSFLLRFRREAHGVKRLHHPNIVPVEDSGQVCEHAFLVMPYLRVVVGLPRLLTEREP